MAETLAHITDIDEPTFDETGELWIDEEGVPYVDQNMERSSMVRRRSESERNEAMERFQQVRRLLTLSVPRMDIKSLCSRSWGMKPRSVEKYISVARKMNRSILFTTQEEAKADSVNWWSNRFIELSKKMQKAEKELQRGFDIINKGQKLLESLDTRQLKALESGEKPGSDSVATPDTVSLAMSAHNLIEEGRRVTESARKFRFSIDRDIINCRKELDHLLGTHAPVQTQIVGDDGKSILPSHQQMVDQNNVTTELFQLIAELTGHSANDITRLLHARQVGNHTRSTGALQPEVSGRNPVNGKLSAASDQGSPGTGSGPLRPGDSYLSGSSDHESGETGHDPGGDRPEESSGSVRRPTNPVPVGEVPPDQADTGTTTGTPAQHPESPDPSEEQCRPDPRLSGEQLPNQSSSRRTSHTGADHPSSGEEIPTPEVPEVADDSHPEHDQLRVPVRHPTGGTSPAVAGSDGVPVGSGTGPAAVDDPPSESVTRRSNEADNTGEQLLLQVLHNLSTPEEDIPLVPDTDEEDESSLHPLERPIHTFTKMDGDRAVEEVDPEARQIHAPKDSITRGRPIMKPRPTRLAGDE